MDLLGHFGQKSGDERYPYQEGSVKNERRNAPTMLLVRLPSYDDCSAYARSTSSMRSPIRGLSPQDIDA
ncbi:MAG: hypothetical protein A3B99_04570 [Candidatus Yanofskybacteria bacterium RIFCSPHIGHO2_02_FULL_44_12b]|uniref:Uncharacterized protein n=1 Tax=Candidatus Yanofskybacteria bacterium RIFCSPLOWO2_01_FULL_44_22 TaxID=1802697 RepID=A0A1F8GK76_9BACT|nr:MAG: hypothetical protein A3B99_04570 [Candidatus Yanofskybacteria bacterium RIFCSPHIGHO2_02_FULL_44_12b]OGN25731.1 MAG: hypothetical protein A2925_00910 [Candidatus Yanofskybacteria bacterium RIFCSPLOWO2_01_FULL_44_22]